MPRTDPVARIRARSVRDENGCLVWTGARIRGYGQIGVGGKGLRTHKVMWESVNGPVPEGLELDHLCRNPPCGEPTHLEAVTHLENVRRTPRRWVGFRCGHPFTLENIRVRRRGDGVARACRKCFNADRARTRAARGAAARSGVCGAPMPLAGETCARTRHGATPHRTATAMANARLALRR